MSALEALIPACRSIAAGDTLAAIDTAALAAVCDVTGAAASALMLGDVVRRERRRFVGSMAAVPAKLLHQLADTVLTAGGVPGDSAQAFSGMALGDSGFQHAIVMPVSDGAGQLGMLVAFFAGSAAEAGPGADAAMQVLAVTLAQSLRLTELTQRFQGHAVIDAETGLYSRRFLFETLWQQVKRITRATPPTISCLMIAPAAGLSGDAVRELGAVVSATVRASDIAARYGENSVAVILPQSDEAGAHVAGAKIRAALAEAGALAGHDWRIGVAGYDFAGKDHVRSRHDALELSMALLNQAECALEAAQDPGVSRAFTQ